MARLRGAGVPKAVAALIAAAPLLAAGGPAVARDATEVFYERAFMVAADRRCDLFDDPTSGALSAASLQARGAALRSGVPPAAVARVETRAAEGAARAGCGSSDLRIAAARVRDAFEAWSRTPRMEFPGRSGGWSVDRTAYRSASWRLSQTVSRPDRHVIFGVAGRDRATALSAIAVFEDGARPSSARLVARDPARSNAPWLASGPTPALPPRTAAAVVMAEARAPADPTLLPRGERGGWAFRFPPEAAARLAALDPRERFAVEFVLPDGSSRTSVFEVGDFAAARAFLALGPR